MCAHVAALPAFLQVGESGHGKSTIVGLLERFYDPLDGQASAEIELCLLCCAAMWRTCLSEPHCHPVGNAKLHPPNPHSLLAPCALPACCPCCLLPQVLIDGLSVQKLGLKYLRSQIGLVGQEPIMFRWATAVLHGLAIPFSPSKNACRRAGGQEGLRAAAAAALPSTASAKQRLKLFSHAAALTVPPLFVYVCVCLPAALPSWKTSASATQVPPCPRCACWPSQGELGLQN